MNYTLTAKENSLLSDQKSHEQMCIEKYTTYASQASDPQLKSLFNQHEQTEREHLNTITQLLNGQIPAMNQQQQQQQQQQSMQSQQAQQAQQNQQNQKQYNFQPYNGSSENKNNDKYLCSDLLMTEKYVSDTYDTAIFEFREPQVRDVLNHIQKEEQEHGLAIYKYMESQGMYQIQ